MYGSFLPNKELEEWVQQYYDYEVATRYQIVGVDLIIHVDHGIVGMKANYLIIPEEIMFLLSGGTAKKVQPQCYMKKIAI